MIKTHRLTLTNHEVIILSMVFYHLTDYMAGDDRPDHGWNKLKQIRDFKSEDKEIFYKLYGKFWRAKMRNNNK